MKPIYVLRIECGDPWARYTSDACYCRNKKQLEDFANRINKKDPGAGAYVTELTISDSLSSSDYAEVARYYGLDT